MAYVRFMNGANPLWDFISEMAAPNQHQPRDQEPSQPSPFERRHRGPPPGSWGWSPFDFNESGGEQHPWAREMPHRPHRPHPHHGHAHGPRGHHPPTSPPPGTGDNPPPPPEYSEDEAFRAVAVQPDEDLINMVDNTAATNADPNSDAKGPAPDPEISTPNEDENENAAETSGDEGRRGWHGRRGRHEHSHHHGPPPHAWGFGGPGFGRRGGWGGHGRGGMRGCRGDPRGHPWAWAGNGPHGPGHQHPYARHFGRHGSHHRRRGSGPGDENPFAAWANVLGLGSGGFDAERLREAFADALQAAARGMQPRDAENEQENGTQEREAARNKDIDFRPSADIYDAASEYVVHFALPGAKKEDISLNWDAENSELNVAGVIAREGDEEVSARLRLTPYASIFIWR